jgi:hypothetical protein
MFVGFGTTTVVVPTGNGFVLCHAIMPAPPPIGGYVLTSGVVVSTVHPAGGVSEGSGPTVPSLKTKIIPKQFGTFVVRLAVMLVVEKVGGEVPPPESNVAFTEVAAVGESAYANAL